MIDGATLLARSLKLQGVEHVFGIVGFPVAPVADACQREGIKFYGMRNEQAASYAAQAAGYLMGRPQGCLVVSGPGVIHALPGLGNASINGWPMILLGGATETYQTGMGGFQAAPQVDAARLFSKYSERIDSVARIPYYIEQATRYAMYGRPGAAYVDLPSDIILGTCEEPALGYRVPEPPRSMADPGAVNAAIDALQAAERPLVIVGKGMAWSRAEHEVREFIEKSQLPFLASPMGKGVVPDNHPLSVAAARTFALQNTDLVLLMGARLNWIMHFGRPPRWAEHLKVIQIDVVPEEIGNNVPATVALAGDGRAITAQLNQALDQRGWQFSAENTWRTALHNRIAQTVAATEPLLASDDVPMGYYRVLREISEAMDPDTVLVSEGASTMDISRQVILNSLPRTRLDAGSWGTMGVGLGFAIAAAAVSGKRVIDLEGDAAFGFSGMEVETACRYNLPITFVIVNNNGIGGGPLEPNPDPLTAVPGAYTPGAHYERMAEAFGGQGFYCTRPEEIRPALAKAAACEKPSIVNIVIDNHAQRRPQEFNWHTH